MLERSGRCTLTGETREKHIWRGRRQEEQPEVCPFPRPPRGSEAGGVGEAEGRGVGEVFPASEEKQLTNVCRPPDCTLISKLAPINLSPDRA